MNVSMQTTRFGLVTIFAVTVFGSACDNSLNFGPASPSSLQADTKATDPASVPALSLPATTDASGATPQERWTWLNPKPTGSTLYAGFALTDDDAWLVGENGTILRDRNGKVEIAHQGDPDVTYYAVWASGPDNAWVAGEAAGRGELLHWDGKAWTKTQLGQSNPINALWGFGENDVWAFANDAADTPIAWHLDGSGWQAAYRGDPRGCRTRDFWGTKTDDMWGVCEGAILRHMTLSGVYAATPTPIRPGLSHPFSPEHTYIGVWGDSSNDVWAVYVDPYDGQIGVRPGHSNVGFVHWDGSALQVTQIEKFEGVIDIAPRRGRKVWGTSHDSIVALAGELWRYDGARWKREKAPEGASSFYGSSNGKLNAIVGNHGVLRATPNGSWSDRWPAVRIDFKDANVAQDGALLGLDDQSSLVRWANDEWKALPSAPFTARHLQALATDDVWLGGEVWHGDQANVAIAHFDGKSWGLPIPLPVTSDGFTFTQLTGISTTNTQDVWALGYGFRPGHGAPGPWGGGAIYAGAMRWNGTDWLSAPIVWTGEPELLCSVRATASDDVWFTGTSSIVHWDGTVAREVHRAPRGGRDCAVDVRPIAPLSKRSVWAAFGARLDHFDGKAWSTIVSPASAPGLIKGIWARSDSDVWLLVVEGLDDNARTNSVYHWDGKSLTRSLKVAVPLNAITGDAHSVYVVGDNGATLRFGAESQPSPH